MRDYGIISPKFWIGKTGRKLRAHPYAQRVALYLMTAPNADMTGVYYCPLSSILNDVGSPSNVPLKPLESPFEAPCEGYKNPFEGVKDALSVLEELGFCVYDEENEYVFVVEMARWQVAESLKATDNRVKGIKKYVESMPEGLRQRFINRYNDAFSLGLQTSPIEAPCKPLRSQEQDQEQNQKQEKSATHSTRKRVERPADVDPQVWEDWQTARKSQKAPITQTVIDGFRKEAREARISLEEAVRISIERGWRGFKAEWLQDKGKSSKPTEDEIMDRYRISRQHRPADLPEEDLLKGWC